MDTQGQKGVSLWDSFVSLGRHRFAKRTLLALTAGAALATAGAYALFVTHPDIIRLSPVSVTVNSSASLPAEVKTLEAQSATLLFDRDTTQPYVAYADQSVDAQFEKAVDITSIKIYGPAPFELTVRAQQGNSWNAIPGLSQLDLTSQPTRWNTFTATQQVSARAVRLELVMKSGATTAVAGLNEIEIWGKGEHALVSGSTLVSEMSGEANTPKPAQARLYSATPASTVVGKDSKSFTFTLDRPATNFKRAWLAYETYGINHWVTPTRRINGQSVQGGQFVFTSNEWNLLTEPVHPAWLKSGSNTLEFSLPANTAGTYSLRNVRVIAELDDGSNAIEAITTGVNGVEYPAANLNDGNLGTGWSPYYDPRSKGGKPELMIHFDKPTQVDTLWLNLANTLGGTLTLQLNVAGEWQSAGINAVNGRKLGGGWNKLSGFAGVPATAVRVIFENGDGSAGEIREVLATGSGVGTTHAARIAVAYPDAGQFYGRTAYLRGFLTIPDNGSGPAVISAGNQKSTTADGSFGLLVSKDEAGFANQADAEPWQVTLEARYPDGKSLTQVVKLYKFHDADKAKGLLPNTVNPGFAALVTGGDAALDIDPDALDKPVNIKITPLKEHELPPLDPGMTNVTPGPWRGYRFTPHGTHFKKHVKVTLPYDPAIIPKGLNEQDVKTYYFDTELNRWVVLDRYRVDNGKRKVTSLTNHFTDMINATLVVPDHPETTSYNATQMKDIKAADPGAGINLIEPPKANNMGDARLSYPIEIPPGRLGMQPQLAISYNSGGGNGWLGLGWDLSVPSITIDTRWGAPRYSETLETETYMLNGEMLTPVAHRGQLQNRNTSENRKQFYARVEGAFQRIYRYGTNPSNYWWEVTDKNGVKYIYGGENNAKHEGSTLGGDKGVFRWALRKTIDPHKNTVVYHYAKRCDTGHGTKGENADGNEQCDAGAQAPGYQIYVSKITYTGSDNSEGRYSVMFKRDTNRRPDIIVDARGGFKQVTGDRLKEIEVRYRKDDSGEGELVRRYELTYKENTPFNKTLLEQVTQYGTDGTTPFNTHSFAYYDEIRDEKTLSYLGFQSAQTGVDTGTDNLKFNTPGGNFPHTVLGGTEGYTVGFDGYAGIGFPVMGTKNAHVGVAPSRSESKSEGSNAFFDVDGDGLPDKVFLKGGKAYYRPNTTKLNSDTISFAASGTAKDVGGLATPSASESQTTNAAVQGLLFGVSANVSQAVTNTRDMSYLADVNGDGLVDLVNRGQVLFNTAKSNGNPNYSANSYDTSVPLGNLGGAVDSTLLPDVSAERTAFETKNPLMDNVRRWVAPHDGTIRISGNVQLIDVLHDQRFEKLWEERKRAKPDGVRVAIQHNGEDIWSDRLHTEYTVDSKSTIKPYSPVTPAVADRAVKKGDKIYFRVQSIYDGDYDTVSWSPAVEYVANAQPATFMDANNLNTYHYQAAEDFILANRSLELSVPHQGLVRLAGLLNKTKVTSDDITLRITVIDYHQEGNNIIASAPKVEVSKQISRDYTGPIPLSEDFSVNKMSGVHIDFVVDSNVDLTSLKWGDLSLPEAGRTGYPELYYTEAYQEAEQPVAPTELTVRKTLPTNADDIKPKASDKDNMAPILGDDGKPLQIPAQKLTVADAAGNYIFKMPVKYNMDIYPVNNLTTGNPQEPWVAPRDGVILWTPWVSINEMLALNPITGLKLPSADIQKIIPDGSIFVTAKREGIRLAKQEVLVREGSVVQTSNGYYGVNALRVKKGDRIFFDATVRNQLLETRVTNNQVSIHYASDTPWIAPITDQVNFLTNYHGGVPWATPAEGQEPPPPPDERAMFVIRKDDKIVYSKLMDFAQANEYALSVQQQVAAGEHWYFDVFTLNPELNVSYDDTFAQYTATSSFKAPQSGTLSLMPVLNFGAGVPDGIVLLNVRVDGRTLEERNYVIKNGQLDSGSLAIGLEVTVNQTVTFHYSTNSHMLSRYLRDKGAVLVDYVLPPDSTPIPNWTPKTVGSASFTIRMPVLFKVQENEAVTRHYPLDDVLFGNPYRGWGTGAYNGNGDRKDLPISETLFFLSKKESDYKDTTKERTAWGAYPVVAQNPSSVDIEKRWWLKQSYWGSEDDRWWTAPYEVSSSRQGNDSFYDPRQDDFSETRAYGFAPASRPPKMSKSDVFTYGAGFYLSATQSDITGKNLLDVMDMNGDRYPDVISNGLVQYTWADGTFYRFPEADRVTTSVTGTPRQTDESMLTIGLGPGAPSGTENGSGEKPKIGDKIVQESTSVAVSGGLSMGESEIPYELNDINGDGLPDRVRLDGAVVRVQLNTGYGFAPEEKWLSPAAVINSGNSTGISLSASAGATTAVTNTGYSSWNSTVGGGVSVSHNHNYTNAMLMDINGDGLPDLVSAGNDDLSVSFNTGSGFASAVTWPRAIKVFSNLFSPVLGGAKLADGASTSASISAKYSYGFDIWAAFVPIFNLSFSGAANVGMSVAQPSVSYVDVNGDGYVDGVRTANDNNMDVAINPIGKTNLLKEVHRPLGATITLEYERNGNTYKMPQSRHVMSKVTVNDGHPGRDGQAEDGPDTLETRYRYEEGYYDRYERDFYGFQKVIEEQLDTAADAVYRSVSRTFHTDGYYTKGLLASEKMEAHKKPYTETNNTYELKTVAVPTERKDIEATIVPVFPQLKETEKKFFEGGAGEKRTVQSFLYDEVGNVIHFDDSGDDEDQDDVTARITYTASRPDCQASYIVGKPLTISVFGNGKEMRYREGVIPDCNSGNLTELQQKIGDGQMAQTTLTYEGNGNLKSVTGPINLNNERYTLTYDYDTKVFTHVVKVRDSFEYESTAIYNLKYGKPESTTDLNGNVISYDYDKFGRTVAIQGPYEKDSDRDTLHFTYGHDAPIPYALTEHLNLDAAEDKKDPINTVLFTDGLKRVLQTKKSAAVNGEAKMIVSGRVEFDGLGRTVKQYYPTTEPTDKALTFNNDTSVGEVTTTTFDVLDRTLSTVLPDGTVTTMEYGFGKDRDSKLRFSTRVTDALLNSKVSYRDIGESITAVKEFNDKQILWTSYAYDPLNQITEVRDVKDKLTKVEYDMLGRRTAIDNPDTGRTVTVYDAASNVKEKITANLARAGKAIKYDYKYNRLKSISYPDNRGNDVSYEYGDASLENEWNQIGRLIKVSDASGSQELFYGKLGETVKEVRTIASRTQGASKNSPEVYTTGYRYDSFARLLELSLPDSEVITYVYDEGGNLKSFAGDKQGTQVTYLDTLHYDKFEQRSYMKLGNGIETTYSYDPKSRRLDNLLSEGARAGTFQNLHYGYDKVGNILSLNNNVDVPAPNSFGGPNSQTFKYDDLYRLVHGDGEYKFAPDKKRNYTLDLTYDTNHNILRKVQTDKITTPDGSIVPQKGTSYDWSYSYDEKGHPHAPTKIGNRSFDYDLNGNQNGWQSDLNGTRRYIAWDEENRIAEIDDNGHRNKYVYDAAGERVIKTTQQGETVYVNQYYVVRNRSVVSKHLYAGSSRLVSHLVMGTAPGNEDRGAPGNGHGSDNTPSLPDNGNGPVDKGNNGKEKEHSNNGLHLGQLKNGTMDKVNPGQGRERRSDTANQHAQDIYKNPTLTGEHPGQGINNRSARANSVAKNTSRNPNLVIREGEASVELGGDISGGETTSDTSSSYVVNGQSEFIWYYHPDHLGSTGFVTDANGELYEHVEYFPFGETWVQEHSNTQRTPYLYTGKELDEETQLYYYGARYYDPRTSVWQSADPVLGEYLNGGTNNGVYGPININLYRYAALNPLRLIDPTGRSEEESECDDTCQTEKEIRQYHKDWAQGAKDAGEAASTMGDIVEAAAPTPSPTGKINGGSKLIKALVRLFKGKGDDVVEDAAKVAVKVPGRVQSRINVSNEGWDHVVGRHFSGKSNASQFSISQEEVKTLLGSKDVVGSPVMRTVNSEDGIRYLREVDVGRAIGVDMTNNSPTSIMTIMTDMYGNLVTTFPGVLK